METKQPYKKARILAVAGALGIAIIASSLAWRSKKHFEDSIVASAQELLSNTAKAKAESIGTVISDIQANLGFVAGDPRVQDAAAKSKSYEDVMNTEGYSALEAAHKQLAGKIHGLYRMDTEGRIRSRIPWDATRLGNDYSGKPGIKTVMETHKPYVSDLFESNSGRRCFSVCQPIFKEQQFVGIIRAAVHLSTIREMVKQIKVGKKGYVQIIDDKGNLLAHPADEQVGKNIISARKELFPDDDWLELEEIVREMRSGKTGVGIYRSAWWQDEKPAIVKKLTAYAPIRFGSKLWSLGAVTGYDEVAGSIETHSRTIAAGLLSTMLSFFVIGSWFYGVQKERTKLVNEALSADRLRMLNEQLKTAKCKAETASQAKGQFLANMSHEIRTPMNAIVGFSGLMVDEDLTKEQRTVVSTISESAASLLSLIDDILDFSKIEAGQLDVEKADFSLGRLLNSIESVMKAQADEKSIDFKIMANSDVPAHIHSDSHRLRQCLLNLINNALKFVNQGHVYLKVSLNKGNGKHSIHFDIEDTGIGIPRDRQVAIFESFTQADGSTTRKYGGTGLGLAVTKQLVHLLGGELTLTSEPGKGSVFSFSVPTNVDIAGQPVLDRSKAHHQEADELCEADTGMFSGSVLVAEDVKGNQILMKLMLAKLGIDVVITEDGNQALQKALSQSFDLILMDMQMPYMSGYEVTRALRQQGYKTPIVALTANAMKGDDLKCIDAGCDGYLTKPIDRRELPRVLAKYLPAKHEGTSKTINSAPAQPHEPEGLGSKQSSIKTRSSVLADSDMDEIINWDQLVDRLGDEDTIREIMPTYAKDIQKHFDKLSLAVTNGDCESIAGHAHALKGMGRNLSVEGLSDIASRMEKAGRENDIEVSTLLFEDLRSEVEKVVTVLSQSDWIDKVKMA